MPKPETPEENRDRILRELEGKNIQHYSVLLAAWIQTRMERDRALVALSAAAIGLLVTILTTTGVIRWWQLVLYGLAFFGFAVTIWSALSIYQRNSKKIENDIKGSSAPDYQKIDLAPYDRAALYGFTLGAIATISVALSSATLAFLANGDLMSPKSQEPETKPAPPPKEIRSLQGLENLAPKAPEPAPAIQPTPTEVPAQPPAPPEPREPAA